MLSVRETIAIALEVARARAATRELLEATQRQAERLAAQEVELRATNEELQAQEEELRQANTDLSHQTDELEAQRQTLAERNTELDEARVRLEQRAAELSTVSTYKSQFLANMSHELRTPLNSMLLLSNLLAGTEEGTLTPKQVEFARTIYGAGKDLLGLINQVLDLAKVESGRQEVEIGPVSPREIVGHLDRVFTPLARDKGLALELAVAPDVPDPMFTDRRRLEQVLNNLIGNAIKFTPKGRVTFRVARAAPGGALRRPELAAAGAVAFSVTDTGLGIAPENHERVFAPFEQVDAAVDRRYGGTGLGLGIARELATLLGGELQLASVLGAGSTFTLFLPLAAPAAVGAAPATVSPRLEPGLGRGEARRDGRRRAVLAAHRGRSGVRGDVWRGHPIARAQVSAGPERRERRACASRASSSPRASSWTSSCQTPTAGASWMRCAPIPPRPRSPSISSRPSTRPIGASAMGAVGYLSQKPVTRHDLLQAIEALVPKAITRSARFLVVEDDAVTASSVVRLLEAEHLEAYRVSSAEEALAAIRLERFGCMILDLSLPEMTGLDLLQALRDEGIVGVPKVVVYTARALSRAETMALEAYAEAVVLKDGSSAERLLDEVRLFVRRLHDGSGAPRARAPELPPVDVRFEGRRILVVDDDMRTVYALSATLRAKGFEVVVADTGKAALETLDRRPDVEAVLMDIMMPEMDGYEAMRRIRADDRFSAMPIIALTAKAMKGDAEKCVEAGASHYLPKPIDADRLLTLLASCLPRVPGARQHA